MMKCYKLLKDLPNLKKGTILSEGKSLFGARTLITKNDVGPIFIGNDLSEELFEEIKEPTDSIHWKPKTGERYWFYFSDGDITTYLWGSELDDIGRYKLGRVYRTEEECVRARNRELAEVRLRRTSTFKPDFENRNGGWIVIYEYAHYKLLARSIRIEDAGEPVRYATREDAEKSIKENERDWKIYFGVDEED